MTVKIEIIDFWVDRYGVIGNSMTFGRIIVQNTGDEDGIAIVQAVDQDTHTVLGEVAIDLFAGETGEITIDGIMPDHDLALDVVVGHDAPS